MGKVGYLVKCGINVQFYSEDDYPDYLAYDPDYTVTRIVYFEVEDD